jgi:hypothetical protein
MISILCIRCKLITITTTLLNQMYARLITITTTLLTQLFARVGSAAHPVVCTGCNWVSSVVVMVPCIQLGEQLYQPVHTTE